MAYEDGSLSLYFQSELLEQKIHPLRKLTEIWLTLNLHGVYKMDYNSDIAEEFC